MKKLLTTLIISLSTIYSMEAQVGVGTTTPRGALEVNSTTNGFLAPQIALANTTTSTPVVNPQGGALPAGTIVYNTATVADVTPGYYYWNGTIWVRMATATSNNDWSLTGNSGTTPGTNFLGTTDNVELRLRTNNNDRVRIGNTGNVGINTAPPASYKLEVNGGTDDAIYGHSSNVGGILGYESNITLGSPTQTLSGAGVYANNPASGYTSVYAQSTGAADVAANIAYSDVWIASYNYTQNGSGTYNPPASYHQLNVTNSSLGGTQAAIRAYNNRGTTSGNPGTSVGVQATANSRNQDAIGTMSSAYTDANLSFGGFFAGYQYNTVRYAYAYVGGTTNGSTARKITGTGSVSEIIPTEDHGRITLTCPESPEYWYQDYGTVEIKNGKATIKLDPILADIIVVDDENPIRVICTPVGMPYFNGVTIMSQTKNSVELLELNGGAHSGKLQYQLVLKPKTNYGEGRFPQAPGPAYLKSDKEPLAAKAKNQPNDGRTIFQWPADHVVYKYNPEDHIAPGDVVPTGPNAGKVFLGNGKYSEGTPATNPDKKSKK
ncbi:hypothetical protein [Flavobacterium sp. U410]|jgi:hypothetical protein